MPLVDSDYCRQLLSHLFPSIQIESNLRPSGQRLVYFCHFAETTVVPAQAEWSKWGKVVLKVSEDIHPTVIARLEKERDILNSLNSDYFPKLLYCDVFNSDPVTDSKLKNRLFITIEERIAGIPLSECRSSFVSEQSLVALLSRLVEGMTLLWEHPQKIIHRDLKPDNILIRPGGRPVIIDLGIVREQGSAGVTGTHWNIGPCTPAYASPEQLRNEKLFITHKADFFSLGVIAYELMTGSNPFMHSADEPIEVVANRTLTSTPPSLERAANATPRFSALVDKLIQKDAYKRPRTVRHLANELSELSGI